MARGTRLAGEAFAVLKADRRLLLLPAAALLLDVCCAGVLLGFAAGVSTAHNHKMVLLVAFAVGLYPFTVSSTFFNVALMHVVSERWQGRQASVGDGLLLARRRLRVILQWSLLAATVGVALQLMQRVGHVSWLERLLAMLLNFAWVVATFFVLPALALEDIDPLAACKRSVSVVRCRWPESLTGSIAIGGAAAFALIPGIALGVAGVTDFKHDPVADAVLLLIGVALTLPVVLYSNATSALFSLAVWEYADRGSSAGPFAASDLEDPFNGGQTIGKARRWIGTQILRRPPS